MSQICRQAFLDTFSYEHCLSKKQNCQVKGHAATRNLIKLSAYVPILGTITHVGEVIRMSITESKDIRLKTKRNFFILRTLLSVVPPILLAVDLVASTIVLKSLRTKQKV